MNYSWRLASRSSCVNSTQQMWVIPWRLVSKTSCNLIYMCVNELLLAACITIKLHKFYTTDVGYSPAACIKDKMHLNINICEYLLPRLASRSSCVNYTQQMWMRYSLAACTEDKMHLNIRASVFLGKHSHLELVAVLGTPRQF